MLKYLIVLNKLNRFKMLERLTQFNGIRVRDKNTFGCEMTLSVDVLGNNEQDFLQIIEGVDRVIAITGSGQELKIPKNEAKSETEICQ